MKSIKYFEKIPVDPFEAVKRALIKDGYIPKPPAEPKAPEMTKEGKPINNKKRVKHPHELVDLEKQSHEVLFKKDTVFPFILFPNTIILDRTQLTIIHRTFFRVAKISSVRIQDILTTDVNVGPFFGSLRVATRFFVNQDTEDGRGTEIKAPSINFLWKHDALEIHKLLQGFIVATQDEIDISETPTSELKELLRSLGANDGTINEG